MNRRHFIQGIAGAGIASRWTASSYGAVAGAGERMQVGLIGCGAMGSSHIKALLDMRTSDNVEITAVCDVYKKRLEAAAAATGAKTYSRYQELLARKDVDYVVIATPEHWHYRMILDAMEASKHVYVEKPMTQSIAQAREVARRVRDSRLKLQVGVQGMSDESYEVANGYIREGALGKIVMAQIDYSRNYPDDFWVDDIDPEAKPGVNLDWEAWLGPAPPRPWDPRRYFQWRHYWDYSGGIASDLFIHRVTRIIKSAGLTFPERVVASGGTWNFTDSRAEVPETFNMLCDYPGGPTVVLISTMANDTPIRHVIRGHLATLEFDDDGFVITPQDTTREDRIAPSERTGRELCLQLYKRKGAEDITLHHRNLQQAVRKGTKLHCDAQLGYYGVVVTSMGVESFRNRAYLRWNPQTEEVERV